MKSTLQVEFLEAIITADGALIAGLKNELAECQEELAKVKTELKVAENYIATNIPIGIVACDCKEEMKPTNLNFMELARLASSGDGSELSGDAVQRFGEFVAAIEREACAKVCDKEAVKIVNSSMEYQTGREMAAKQCAMIIRERAK